MYKLIKYLRNMSANPECSYKKHAKYFKRFLELLPARLALHDSTRVTIAFFAVCGLDVLNSLDTLSAETKQNIIDWIYRFQVVPKAESKLQCGGFQGSATLFAKTNGSGDDTESGLHDYMWGHLAMTYTGLAMLLTLGDDLSRVNRKAIIDGVAAVQKPDGSFSASVEGHEHDMRFVYCAAAICAMLNDWGSVDKRKMAQYIQNSLRYDYGVSQHYEMEAHGGTTFCAVAALQLSDQLDILSHKTIERIKRWLIFRQEDGFNGRPNKPVDTCYSFWIAATLKILNAFHLTNFEENRTYIMLAEDTIVGGFSKWPGSTSDPFHTYFSLCGLSFVGEPGLLDVMPSLNISMRAYESMSHLHKMWEIDSQTHNISLNLE